MIASSFRIKRVSKIPNELRTIRSSSFGDCLRPCEDDTEIFSATHGVVASAADDMLIKTIDMRYVAEYDRQSKL